MYTETHILVQLWLWNVQSKWKRNWLKASEGRSLDKWFASFEKVLISWRPLSYFTFFCI